MLTEATLVSRDTEYHGSGSLWSLGLGGEWVFSQPICQWTQWNPESIS